MSDPNQQPWLDNKDWVNGQIHSTAGLAWKFMLGFAVLWNAISYAAAIPLLLDGLPSFPDPVYFVMAFPLIGLLLIWQAIKHIRDWRRFGRLDLTLDPYPGSIGGDVGGHLKIGLRPAELSDLEATLSCMRISTSSSGGKTSTSQSVKWRKRANTQLDMAANGARIAFRVAVDGGLPSSEQSSRSYHKWQLRLASKQAGLDRSFEIPVYELGRAEHSRLHLAADAPALSEQQFPAHIVRQQRRSDGLELVYPAGRAGATAWMVFLFGAVFAAAGVYMGFVSADSLGGSKGSFSGGVTGFMALIFTTVGLAIVAIGAYLKLNELRLLIGRDTLTVRRQVGPWKRLRSVPIASLQSIDKVIGMQSNNGTHSTIYYRIKARTSSGDLILGDGIQSQPLADALLTVLRDELGLNDGEGLSAASSNTPPPADLGSRFDAFKADVDKDPIAAAKARRTIKWVKWVANAIGLAVFALVAMQFLDVWK